ncbi:activating signal cointegrator 1 complex subunit 2 isoform X1 [Acipenser oxyrinchus oxyrinchus]|uniref:Activating signal cointegrator 1 complex subunit 2 isoform X1 n=1 Tax=Acipenser oxyrinchus oxyrinchus TaxID=40147 RepID=A0AAD8CGY8_ACIOX|nr:activating signal cointegrator 1 complex subunit 2 isoform X1 [Acipenser oxyrinchus oxyrinchus]
MQKAPLDELQVTERDGCTGRERTLSALHPERMEERCFVMYRPPTLEGSPAQVEEYLEQAQFIAEDLDWLLALPHDKFWCQVVFDVSLQQCLDSYLRLAPRGLDCNLATSPRVSDMQRHLHRCVFMTFLRMATHKESREHFLSPAVFGEIIYNNFLFDIPKILDLCVLFGKGNGMLLNKMIENIFTQQPGYYSDLDETVPTILQVLDTILQKCGLQTEGASNGQPLKLGAQSAPGPMDMSVKDLVDLALYLCDTCTTLFSFLDIFPPASTTFQKHSFLLRLASFYELCVPELENAVRKRKFEEKSLQEDLWRRLSHSRRKMVEISHLLINHTCLQPILENSSSETIQVFVEDFLQLFTALLQEKRFLADYDEQFPVADDVSLLQQASPLLDETRASYILQGIDCAWESLGRKKHSLPSVRSSPAPELSSETRSEREGPHGATGGTGAQQEFYSEDYDPGAPGCALSAGELESLVFQVRDLLPDLGEGFIMACLQEYGNNSERVINNILEGKLSPRLEKLDHSLPRPVKEQLPEVLKSRSNVFDDDEFDVFTRDVLDTSRIWKGRRQGESARALVNNKQHVEEQRGRYRAYEVVMEEVPVREGEEGGAAFYSEDYDDEYDDTYDGGQVGANDLDEGSELLARRPFTTPRVLRDGREEEELKEERDYKEEEEEKDTAVTRDQFVQDPAVLRERAEARRAANYNRRGFKADTPGSVVGAAKGRGQNKETVQERRKKEANKSGRANHNRRAMADRKRNKGMIPS